MDWVSAKKKSENSCIGVKISAQRKGRYALIFFVKPEPIIVSLIWTVKGKH